MNLDQDPDCRTPHIIAFYHFKARYRESGNTRTSTSILRHVRKPRMGARIWWKGGGWTLKFYWNSFILFCEVDEFSHTPLRDAEPYPDSIEFSCSFFSRSYGISYVVPWSWKLTFWSNSWQWVLMPDRDSNVWPAQKLYLRYLRVFSILPLVWARKGYRVWQWRHSTRRSSWTDIERRIWGFSFLSMTTCSCYYEG